jgi:hypothetical protein
VATRFAEDEFTGRYARKPHYWREYRGRIDAITSSDVQRVAKRWLKSPSLVILAVGQKDQIVAGDPDHPVELSGLAGSKLVELPLRDPLTLKPLPSGSPAP